MTVPGKGGRPRKWRSDADRVRAYRARQAGRDEPPELAQALAEGDELARAMEEIRALKGQLASAAGKEQALRQEVRGLRRDLAARDKRFGWLERTASTDRAAREAAERERDELVREVAAMHAVRRVPVRRHGRRPRPKRHRRRRHEPNVEGSNASSNVDEIERPILHRGVSDEHTPRAQPRDEPRDGPHTPPGSGPSGDVDRER